MKQDAIDDKKSTLSNQNNVAKRVPSHTRTVVRECFKGDEASQ